MGLYNHFIVGDQGYGILGRIPHRGSPLLIMLFDGVHVVSMTSTGDVNLDHLFKIMSVTSLLFKDSFFFFPVHCSLETSH